jgi:chromosome segregation ATPase
MEQKSMKSRDTLVRLKQFQVDEKRRRIAQLQQMIAEFTRMTNELDREIAIEEQRANIDDPNHFAYPTYARAARTRRDNLNHSLSDLREKLGAAERQLEEAVEELAKARNQEVRDHAAERMVDIVAERHAADRGEGLRRA